MSLFRIDESEFTEFAQHRRVNSRIENLKK